MFWTVFKADFLFSICTITISAILTLAIALWKKRKNKKTMAALKADQLNGPRAFIIGGKEQNPGHCPLCGQDWPLPGPDALNKSQVLPVQNDP